MELATGPVASVGVKRPYQLCMIETNASKPTSVAQVTNHRTMSLLRQLKDDKVIRITWRPNSNDAVKRCECRDPPSTGTAILNASWANLNSWVELWIFLCEDLRTDRNRLISLLAADSIVEAREHCCISMCAKVNHRGYRPKTPPPWRLIPLSSTSSWSSSIGSLNEKSN